MGRGEGERTMGWLLSTGARSAGACSGRALQDDPKQRAKSARRDEAQGRHGR